MKNRDFITSKFENESITAPSSLSEDAIKARLEQGISANDVIKVNTNKKRIFMPLVSVAACVAIVVASVFSANAIRDSRVEKAVKKNTDGGIVHFTTYDELESFTDKIYDYEYKSNSHSIVDFFSKKSSSFATESAADGALSKSSSYSSTNTQVADVDEADIVKTDGDYIYYIDSADGTLVIVSAKDGKTELASKEFNNGNSDFTEMYLDGDRLYVLGTEYPEDYKKGDKTFVITFDISDRENVKRLDTFEQSGNYSTSRMVDGCIYVISNTFSFDKRFIPYCTGANGDYAKIPADDICAFECCKTPSYAVVGALDTDSGKRKNKKVKAIMGGADNIYCTTDNLYLSCVDYNSGNTSTVIAKYEFDGTDIEEKSVGRVKGYVNNQWSFDENDSFLRVATTASDKEGNEVNKLYVLDDELETVGSVGGYARGEHIEAVRYIGDMAYVITYETTDPLFCIDLSNPKDPRVTGEVKITGFSTNLVPVGDDKLMGIGYSTEENEWGEARNGVKIVLFDISDKNAPKILDTKVYEDAESEAQTTHKAIVINDDEDYLAIPINYYINTEYEFEELGGGVLLLGEKNGKIEIKAEQKFSNNVDRVIYIGDYIYAIDMYEDTVNSFRIK